MLATSAKEVAQTEDLSRTISTMDSLVKLEPGVPLQLN